MALAHCTQIFVEIYKCKTLIDIIVHFPIIQVICETVAMQQKVIPTAPAFAVTLLVFNRV